MTTPNPEAQQPIETIIQPNSYREHDLDEARIVDFMQEDGTIGRGVTVGEGYHNGSDYIRIAQPGINGGPSRETIVLKEDHEALQATIAGRAARESLGGLTVQAAQQETSQPFIEPEDERTLSADEVIALRAQAEGSVASETTDSSSGLYESVQFLNQRLSETRSPRTRGHVLEGVAQGMIRRGEALADDSNVQELLELALKLKAYPDTALSGGDTEVVAIKSIMDRMQ